jgi:hypothetical protein
MFLFREGSLILTKPQCYTIYRDWNVAKIRGIKHHTWRSGLYNIDRYPSPQKGGFLKDAAAEGIALVFPDTSPRGAKIEGEDDDWSFGSGESKLIFCSQFTIYSINL